ncbi:Hrp-dependent type III effector protein [Rhizobium rhizosphaerae]|uniref:Hrp-dependent type III effector protein n=1 Tax=Xaviernesmea rhizosphaerae TaxID=1672749 RepID=A0ABX3PFR6_9HYPH|nr:four-carbon acid sugar kinase family protein [Xaviernesmea rhizosphaerae]OQP87335.1 Hrp-dependent type III effector protein [Xaviernesmea rhizosphaerae]
MADLLLSYYGDDFTGSTDVMEALAAHGVPTVCFLGIPTPELRARFSDCRAIGIAGTSRSQTPDWMAAELPPVFSWLKDQGAALTHYKLCSTFDSAPTTGNIGRAIEIGRQVFAQALVPVVVGAPELKRYTAFGHLFAAYQGRTYRIDRHPVMARHPVTPMDESDLTLHLARQTALPIGLVDLPMLAGDGAGAIAQARDEGKAILFLDVDGAESQAAAGRALWQGRDAAPFLAGSSGVEYALLRAWRAEGLAGERIAFDPPGAVERLAVVSGSVSPTTERQIRAALDDGFEGIAIDPLALTEGDGAAAIAAAVAQGLAGLKAGRSVILYTALGPSADRGGEIDRVADARHRLGARLGTILRRLVEAEGLTRAVIAGGDTSSHALKELRIDALTTRLPLPQTPGSPLCTGHGAHAPTNGLEIALKGGQVGADDYFSQIRAGRAG